MSRSRAPSEIFPERLKLAREKAGLSQAELSRRSGLQPSVISHFETSARRPSFENLRRIADALDVTTDYLLGRVDDRQSLGAMDKLHRHVNEMTVEDKEFFEVMAERLAQRAKQRRKKEPDNNA